MEEQVEAMTTERDYQGAIARIDAIGKSGPLSVRLRQLKGLALARQGSVAEAQTVLGSLCEEGHRDPETLGIYARTWMDRYDKEADRDHLSRSRDLYAEAFDRHPTDYYTGINAAAKSVFLGDEKAGKSYAQKVRKIVGIRPSPGDYWQSATAAEVQLILHQFDKAAELYRSAVQIKPKALGDHTTTWLQAKRLMNAMRTPEQQRAPVERAFQHLVDAAPGPSASIPPYRKLRVFAFDPSASRRVETAAINEVTLRIPWEFEPEALDEAGEGHSSLKPGPVGEYLEVVDYDPASGCFYEPIKLDDRRLLATDGMAPSEGDPRFHQQMVYAVAMSVISHFERALGRRALWATRRLRDARGRVIDEKYVRRLRIYPHALREANAYYSPDRKALLFGYFPAEVDDPEVLPGGIVFTCLSHDVIAHEMSHALLDGLHPRFAESSNPDVLAFHEAFADIVALFHRFTHPEVLEHEIARTRGDLASQNRLGQLAHEFGRAIGRYGSLRDAIGTIDPETREWRPAEPDPEALRTALEPHARGAILVAAVFDAFLTIYSSRIADLVRIATQGSGVLQPGALHPDLVARLAREAAKSANHVLQICIRALDYCPPVDITFGDYLRALITADVDSVPDDRLNYRPAFIEAFQRRGIYPGDVRTLSEESLVWRPPRGMVIDLQQAFGKGVRGKRIEPEWRPTDDREELWNKMQDNARAVHAWLNDYCTPSEAEEIGLSLSADGPGGIYRKNGKPTTEVHSVRVARRTTPSGGQETDFVIEILQRRRGYLDAKEQEQIDANGPGANDHGDFTFRGGCTLLVDPETCRVRYAINKHILSDARLIQQRRFLSGEDASLRATYFSDPTPGRSAREPFALLHRPDEAREQ